MMFFHLMVPPHIFHSPYLLTESSTALILPTFLRFSHYHKETAAKNNDTLFTALFFSYTGISNSLFL